TANRLRDLVDEFGLEPTDRRARESLVEVLADGRRIDFAVVVNALTIRELRDICEALHLFGGGRAKPPLVERILAAGGEPTSTEAPNEFEPANEAAHLLRASALTRDDKHGILVRLTAPRLRAIADALGLAIDDRRSRSSLINALSDGRRADFAAALEHFTRADLREACLALGLPSSGSDKEEIVARILSLGDTKGSDPSGGEAVIAAPAREEEPAAASYMAAHEAIQPSTPEPLSPPPSIASTTRPRLSSRTETSRVEAHDLNWIANFIWGIADDVLRDLYVRGKYRDVILPMTVLRRLDAVLEPTKKAVLDMKASLDAAKVVHQDAALRQAAGQAFYNTSKFTLRDLRSRASQQQLKADFEAYLDGFSPNVQDILENFEFRNQIPRLSKADALGTLIEKLLSPDINLSPNPVLNGDGSVKQPGLDNHGMGTVFEELVRRFNEENNEEAGEHWTPRDAVRLMAKLIFLPIAEEIESGTYLLYDGACGTGGMLTVAEETLQQLAADHGKQVATHLYGQEINAETYAICKADLLLKGEGDAADNIIGGPEYSTLANDAFPSREFDFMLSNPPYGKSWKSDLERMGGKDGLKDPRFLIEHGGDGEYSLVTRSSDGQMLFLANMLSKMKQGTKLGSRIAEVHNGSSLFTGDAGQGESNIRRWIIENDWLEAIVALPLNMFYNTGIATYIWVLTNRKPAHRKGRVQLIDATQWYKPLRKNLGKKNCELSDEDVARICDTFLEFKETEQSKIFPNAAFGYWKVTVERPLRLRGIDSERTYSAKELKALKETAERADDAPPVIRKIHKKGTAADPLRGLFEATVDGKRVVVEYEPDSDLRDTEQVPLLEEGGIEAFLRREVLPHAADAWYVPGSVKTGYEISFTRYFYKPQPLRSLEEIRADILALEKETEGLLDEIIGQTVAD
ncbi:MAG: N-6 DNA methylase, partial [Myxococcales bacterium]|nr:N-6 DNA methylase [Myxococcales bacterium]